MLFEIFMGCNYFRYTKRTPKSVRRKSQCGFTLVEILVSMGILLSLMTISIVSYSKAGRYELIRYGARRLADALQSTQSYAQSGIIQQYPVAQSYGVHTDIASQQIVLFADQNITNGVGRWDGSAADASGKTDAAMQEVFTYDVDRRKDIKLEEIKVVYIIDGGAEQTMNIASLDVAAVRPNARIVFAGGTDFPIAPAGQLLMIKRAIFSIKQNSTGKINTVTIHGLSGRVDVDY